MPERTHHPSGPLAVAIALAAAAGFIDAHLYVNVAPVFVANMSGNLIHFGILVGDGDWERATASVLALIAFTVGVILATIHHDRQVIRRLPVGPHRLLTIESFLLIGITVWLVVSGVSGGNQARPDDWPALTIAALAMGLQAGALRRVGEIAVATTYGTGAIVRIGEKVVLAARRADRSTVHRRRVAIAVLAVVLVSYVIGAVLSTVAGSRPELLVLPTLTLIASAAATRSPRPDRPQHGG